MTSGTATAILVSVFSANERGKVLGMLLTAVYSGLSLGPFLGGSLTQFFGWRSIFLANGILGLAVITLVFWKIKEEWVEAKGEKFDSIGSITYGLTLTLIMYGLSLLPEISGALFTLIGGLGFLVFIAWEIREKSPILNINIFKNNRPFTLSSLSALIFYSANYAVSYVLSLYLQYIKGLTPQNAGLIIASQSIMQAIFSPLAGRLSDKFEPRTVASIGLMLITSGLYAFTLLEGGTSLEFIISILVFLGFGYALFASPNENAIMSSVERRFYGVASGMLATMRFIGQSFSISMTTFIFLTYMGKVQFTPEYSSVFLTGVQVTFVVLTITCILALLASLLRGKIRIQLK